MSDLTEYQEIEIVASSLKRDGLNDVANNLLHAHEGIYNNTELYSTWRQCLDEIVHLPRVSGDTRIRAKRLYGIFDSYLT